MNWDFLLRLLARSITYSLTAQLSSVVRSANVLSLPSEGPSKQYSAIDCRDGIVADCPQPRYSQYWILTRLAITFCIASKELLRAVFESRPF